MTSLAEKVFACCRELAGFTEEPGRTTRTFLSPPMRDVHRALRGWMESIGMQAWVDSVGNLHGLYGDSNAARLMIGSHLDTVPDAGAFDGILGVVMGIAMAELRPRMPIEVVGFSEEEGVRFGFPFIGSLALTGGLSNTLLDRRDKAGISVNEAIQAYGLDPSDIPSARLSPETVAYLEFHIEQGPILESIGLPLGAVEAIAGQSRWIITFDGKANHAGTTPMTLRNDALVAAAQWIEEVESYAIAHEGLVATVGSLNVLPNAGNVIPGHVQASLDVRHHNDEQRLGAVQHLLKSASQIGTARGIAVANEERLNQPAVPMNDELTRLLGLHRMTSGAGHDAMILSPHLPSTMMFLRSPGGISHHPDETVLTTDVSAALEAGARFIEALGAKYGSKICMI